MIDRCLSTGGPGGPVASEVKAMLYGSDAQVPVVEFVAGLGGRDVPVRDFEKIFARTAAVAAGEPAGPFTVVGLRE